MKNKINYIRMDMNRAFCSKEFFIAVSGIVILLYIIKNTQVRYPSDILYIYDGIKMQRMYLMIFIFCVLPYGACFCEDYEKKFYYPLLIRGRQRNYVWSKILTCFISGCITGSLGILLFLVSLNSQYPWFIEESSAMKGLLESGGGFFLTQNLPVLFFAEAAIKEGLLMGVLTVCTAFFSLFLKISCLQ